MKKKNKQFPRQFSQSKGNAARKTDISVWRKISRVLILLDKFYYFVEEEKEKELFLEKHRFNSVTAHFLLSQKAEANRQDHFFCWLEKFLFYIS